MFTVESVQVNNGMEHQWMHVVSINENLIKANILTESTR